jgi:hypothetical protein
MLLAYDFPMMSLFWSMLFFFLWMAWILVLIRVIWDIFATPERRGLAKAGWLAFVIIVPVIGVVSYIIVNGSRVDEYAAHPNPYRDNAYGRGMTGF